MTVDVAARLAQGRPAVANTEAYVDACRAVGYQNADLTSRGGQIGEWYSTEDGLDLAALDADCAALRAAAGAAEEALRIERAGMAALGSAWGGESGSAAAGFVERHCSAGAAVAEAVRSAAEVCAALRDKLWGAVDAKVAAATAIDDRRAGERTAWLAAARTVTTGAADREAATEIVRQQITPYVDADIRTEWLGAMRSATGAVDAAYDEATGTLGASGAADFAVPARLGPPIPAPATAARVPADQSPPPAGITPAAVPVLPAAASAPEMPAVAPVPEMPAAQPVPPAAMPTPPATDLAPPLGGPGAGIPAGGGTGLGSGGGLSALVSEIIDALGGLFDEPTDDPGGPTDGDVVDPVDPPDGKPDEPDEKPADEKPTDEKPADDEPVAGEEPVVPQPDPIVPDATAPPPVEPEPEPAPAVPPPGPPEPDPSTPCEIAADELPQVGQ